MTNRKPFLNRFENAAVCWVLEQHLGESLTSQGLDSIMDEMNTIPYGVHLISDEPLTEEEIAHTHELIKQHGWDEEVSDDPEGTEGCRKVASSCGSSETLP